MGDVGGVLRRQPRTVRITDAQGRFAAFGFLLGPELVLTTAEGGRQGAQLSVGVTPLDSPVPIPVRAERVVAEAGVGLLRRVCGGLDEPGARLGRDVLLARGDALTLLLDDLRVPVRITGVEGGRYLLQAEEPGLPRDVSGAPVVDADDHVVGLVVDGETDVLAMAGVDDVLTWLPQTARWRAHSPLPDHALSGSAALGGPFEEPLDRIIGADVVPLHAGRCPECGEERGRADAGQPARQEGYCPACGTPFSLLPDLRAGDVLAGRYRVKGCLARGGHAWIYLAEDLRQPAKFVVLKGRLDSRAPHSDRLRREAECLARLDHPGIVKTSGLVTGAEAEYIVLDYVPGPSLRELLDRRLALHEVVALTMQILDVLDYIHGRGLLYCDMKPDNVILSGGSVKLIDFDAVRAVGDQTSPFVYTPAYRAPEYDSRERGPTVRSDLYSVGRVLQDLARASGAADPVLRDRRPLTAVLGVVARAMADHDERFATAAEMAEQLDGVLREILALEEAKGFSKRSLYFAPFKGPLDAGLGEAPPLEECVSGINEITADPPASQAIAAGLPDLHPYAEESVGAAAPALQECRRLIRDGDLQGAERALHDALTRARALIEGGGDARWVVAWHLGLIALAKGEVPMARTHFEDVVAALPGEAVPQLALALCLEHQGRHWDAEEYYTAVRHREPDWGVPVFGQARVRLAGGQHRQALACLDGAALARPGGAAAVAAVRLSCATRIPTPDGAPVQLGPADIGAAVSRLTALAPAGDSGEALGRDRLRSLVWQAAYQHLALSDPGTTLEGSPPVLGPVDLDLARKQLIDALMALVPQARSAEERKALTEQSRKAKGRRLLRLPDSLRRHKAVAPRDHGALVVTVSQNRFLAHDDTEMHAVVQIHQPAGRTGPLDVVPWLRLQTHPDVTVKLLRELHPIVRDLTSSALRRGDRVLEAPLGALRHADGTTIDLHLCLTMNPPLGPAGEDLQAAAIEIVARPDGDTAPEAAAVSLSAAVPVLVHTLAPTSTDRRRLSDAVSTLLDARRSGQHPGQVRHHAAFAASLARTVGDDTVLRLLEALDLDARTSSPITADLSSRSELASGTLTSHRQSQASRSSRSSRSADLMSSARTQERRRIHAEHSLHSRFSTMSLTARRHGPGHSSRFAGAGRTRGRGASPALRHCPRCDCLVGADDLWCIDCGLRLAPVDEPALEPPPGRVCERCGHRGEPDLRWCACGAPLGPGGPRMWCLSDEPARVGQTTSVAFAVIAGDGPSAGPPLPQPVKVRVLLEAWDAAVSPITQVTLLTLDRTIDQTVFDVVPARAGVITLTFRVYLEPGGRLLQETQTQLSVEAADGTDENSGEVDEPR